MCGVFWGSNIVLLVLSCMVVFDVLCSNMGLCFMKWNCVCFGVLLKFSLKGCVMWIWWYWILFSCMFSSSLLIRLCMLGRGVSMLKVWMID